MAKSIVILGALSGIGEATARRHADRGDNIFLVARHQARLEIVRADLIARGATSCTAVVLDLSDVSTCEATLQDAAVQLGGKLDAVYLFYGALGDQARDEHDLAAAKQMLAVNFSSAAIWCLAVANQLEAQDGGVLIVLSSVAGERGRQSNYIYGAAKSGLTTLVQGIAHRLARGNARAIAVRLGFVDTPMTAHIEHKGLLWAKPDAVAAKLLALSERSRTVAPYLPWFWWPIMQIIKSVPSAIFHKTRL